MGGKAPLPAGKTRRRPRFTLAAAIVRKACGAALLAPFLAGGCGWFADDKGFFVNRSDDYIDAKQHPALVIPEDLGVVLEDPFPIPPVPVQQNARFFPGRPPPPDAIYANDNRDAIRIQRLGGRIWLVVPEPPTTVWPKIKQFLAENGVGIAAEQPSQGRITTDWLAIEDKPYRDVMRTLLRELKASANAPGGRDRVILQVEQGLRELTSEVHARHQSAAEAGGDAPAPAAEGDGSATAASDLAELPPRLLNELGAYIAARVAEQTVSMVAQEIAGQAKSALGRDATGAPVLRLFLDEERAWATLGQALANAGAEVLERDRQGGAYHVRIPQTAFLGGERERGFFRRMFSFGGEGDAAEVMLRVRQEDERIFGLTVLAMNGEPAPLEFAQQVLVLLREYSA